MRVLVVGSGGREAALAEVLGRTADEVVVTPGNPGIPGSTGPVANQGVSAEVGETQVALDLDVVIEYGVSIADLGRSVQRNVKNSVERMTGLQVTEVNISVNDIHLPEDDVEDDDTARPARVL